VDKEKPSNVINFPRFISDAPRTAEEVKENLQMYKESYANDLAEIIWENVLSEMARANCDFDEDINKYFPNMILIFEAIKALHLQTLGASHPLQEFALKNVAILETDEDGTTTGGLKSTLLDELGVDKDEDL
jgi:thermostable 8-oxoguanine DNA glycosylase